MRKTPLLKAVKELFLLEKKPISVPEIQNILAKKKLFPNKTSLYRLLKKLKETNFIEEVMLNNKTIFYEIKTHHHHHFTCLNCGKIECIKDNNLEEEVLELEKKLFQKGFSIKDHNFFITGKCLQCNV